MRNISFALTVPEFISGNKSVTRRLWKDNYAKSFHEKEILQAYDKMPYCGGRKIGKIELTKTPYKQKLKDMPIAHLLAEGGRWHTVYEFINFLGENPETEVWVIEFKKI